MEGAREGASRGALGIGDQKGPRTGPPQRRRARVRHQRQHQREREREREHPPASTISAPTAVKSKGKRPAAEEKTAAAAALASIGFDTSVPVGELPLATKRTMMATAKTVIEYFGTTSARGIESIDLRSSTNGSIIHLARVSQPRDADVVVSSKTQLRRGRDVMGAVDCAGGGSSNRAGTLAAAGRVDRPSFTQAAGVLGIVTCTKLDPKKTLEMFVSVGFTYTQFRLLKSIMLDHFKLRSGNPRKRCAL